MKNPDQAVADAEDLAALRVAKKEEQDAAAVPLDQVIEEFGLSR